MEQEKVWDYIAGNWKEHRNFPLEEVEKFLKNKKGKFLDLGCGSGRNIIKLKDSEFYGVDFSKNQIEFAKNFAKNKKIKAKFFKANCWELPFEDDFFDVVIFIASLHCISSSEKREKSLEELKRVMKKNSKALISVWDKNQEKFKDKKEIFLAWGSGDFPNRQEYLRYYYLYDKEEFLELLKKYFKIINVKEKDERDRFSRINLIVEVQKI